MSKLAKGARAALIVIGIVLLGIGGVLLLGTSGSSASGVGGALTGLGQALGMGAAIAGGLLLLLGFGLTARSKAGSAQEARMVWPPVIDRSPRAEAGRSPRAEAGRPPVASTVNDHTQTDR